VLGIFTPNETEERAGQHQLAKDSIMGESDSIHPDQEHDPQAYGNSRGLDLFERLTRLKPGQMTKTRLVSFFEPKLVSDQDKVNANLRAQADHQEKANANLRARADDQEEVNANLRAQANDQEEVNAILRARADDQEEVNANLRARADDQEKISANLRAQADDQEMISANLRARADDQEKANANLRARADDQEKISANLQARLDQHDSILSAQAHIRSRHLEWMILKYDRYVNRTSLPPQTVQAIKTGDSVAHDRDAMLDAELYERGFRSDPETYVAIYGISHTRALELSRYFYLLK
jgi:hypothetical protein